MLSVYTKRLYITLTLKFFNRKKKHIQHDISLDDFKQYFSTIFDDIRTTHVEEADSFCRNGNMNLDDPTFEELNRQIDVSEVQSAIKNLKRNKSVCPSDNLLHDYFIESSDILSTHITDIYNKVLSTGYFPGSWIYCSPA